MCRKLDNPGLGHSLRLAQAVVSPMNDSILKPLVNNYCIVEVRGTLKKN